MRSCKGNAVYSQCHNWIPLGQDWQEYLKPRAKSAQSVQLRKWKDPAIHGTPLHTAAFSQSRAHANNGCSSPSHGMEVAAKSCWRVRDSHSQGQSLAGLSLGQTEGEKQRSKGKQNERERIWNKIFSLICAGDELWSYCCRCKWKPSQRGRSSTGKQIKYVLFLAFCRECVWLQKAAATRTEKQTKWNKHALCGEQQLTAVHLAMSSQLERYTSHPWGHSEMFADPAGLPTAASPAAPLCCGTAPSQTDQRLRDASLIHRMHCTSQMRWTCCWFGCWLGFPWRSVGAWSVWQQGALPPTEKGFLTQGGKEMEAQITASDFFTLCFSNSGRSLSLQLMSSPCRSGLIHSTQRVVESKILYKVYPCWSEIYSQGVEIIILLGVLG